MKKIIFLLAAFLAAFVVNAQVVKIPINPVTDSVIEIRIIQRVIPAIDTTTPVPVNVAPNVSAGADQTITAPTATVTLSGSANDPDGSIASVQWSKISGPAGSGIVTPGELTTAFTGLVPGAYVLKLTATDNRSAMRIDTVRITVNPAPVDPGTPSAGLTGYGTIVDFNPFNKLDQDQLGKGSLVPNPTNPKDTVFNAQVTKGDPSLSSGWRSEQNVSSTPIEGGYEFDFYPITLYSSSLFWQCHGNSSGTSGVAALWTAGSNSFQVVRSVVVGTNIYQKGPATSFALNTWHHARLEWKWASDNTGYFRVFLDGKLVYNEAEGVKTADPKGQYGKIGVNLFSSQSTSNPSPGSMKVLYNNLYVFKK